MNLDRRLRQHNGELQGGARATHGKTWKRLMSVLGFPTKQAALQFEWKWKYLSRTSSGATAVERRCRALVCLLNSEQSTTNALPFYTYDHPLQVIVEDQGADLFLRDKEMRYGVLLE